MKKDNTTIHPNTPAKTRRTLQEVKRETGIINMREASRRLGINIRYLQQLVVDGIEPTDKTENGQRVRQLLGLPKRKPKPRKPKPPPPEWLKVTKRGIRKMAAETNRRVLIIKK